MSIHEDPSTWRLHTAGGIPYKLVDGNPTGSFDEENAEVTEKYIIQASNLQAFVKESFPPMIVWDGRFSFESKRPYPGLSTLVTQRVSFEPLEPGKPCDPYRIDPGAPEGTYAEFLRLTISYATQKQNDVDPDDPETFLEVSADAAGEFLMLPADNANAKWSTDLEPVTGLNVPLGQMIPQTDWTVRWPQLPAAYLPTVLGRIRAVMGRVNGDVMTLLHNAEVETVLCMGYSFREQDSWRADLDGRPPVELEVKFLEKSLPGEVPIGHNHFYRQDTGEYDTLLMSGEKVYGISVMDNLFVPV